MLADENITPCLDVNLSGAEGTTIASIQQCMENTMPRFIMAKAQSDIKKNLNENQLTQIFVEQATLQIRKICNNISILNQYSDTFYSTTGIPDFYFYLLEEGKTHYPLFVVESKRLPAPDHKKIRENEYVKGDNNNGGIERYKIEKHGIHLGKSGMLGFIEKETHTYWIEKINGWIADLVGSDNIWKSDEILSYIKGNHEYCFLESVAHRISKNPDIKLYHWWSILSTGEKLETT
jgi:hypothetical protein